MQKFIRLTHTPPTKPEGYVCTVCCVACTVLYFCYLLGLCYSMWITRKSGNTDILYLACVRSVEKSHRLALKQKSPILCEFISAGQDLRGRLVLASEAQSMPHVCDPSTSTTLNKLANHACAIKRPLMHWSSREIYGKSMIWSQKVRFNSLLSDH